MAENESRVYVAYHRGSPLLDLFNSSDPDIKDWADVPELLEETGDLIEITIRKIGVVRSIHRVEVELDSAE